MLSSIFSVPRGRLLLNLMMRALFCSHWSFAVIVRSWTQTSELGDTRPSLSLTLSLPRGKSSSQQTSERWQAALACIAVLSLQTQPLSAESLSKPSPTQTEKVLEEILGCVASAQEAVLLPKAVKCAAYQKGKYILNEEASGMPLKEASGMPLDAASACGNSEDWRILPGYAIKQLAKQSSRIDPQGIRLMGAIFCETVDLIGLELQYSLVLDRSIFLHGIQGRSFRTHGDFSVEDSLIFGELYLARVHIDGSIFANGSLMNTMRLLDAEVHGSLLFRKTRIFDLAAFDTVLLSGELSLRDSRFSYLLIQYSKIGGVSGISTCETELAG
jgi:hypothetical protein